MFWLATGKLSYVIVGLVLFADGVILPVVLLLNGLGYVMIYRLDVFNKRPEAPNQLLWTVIGVTVYIATMAIVKRSRDLDRYRYLLLLASLILLASPLVPGVGADINGARLWVVVGGLAFQPVEIAKLTLTIFFASYFVEKREMLTISTKRFGNRMIPDLRPFGPLALALALSLFAIGTEHDVGFLLIVGSGLRIAATARSEFSKLLAAGLTILIGFQTFFILAGIERVLPLTGITLPWMSYGGSSLISNYFLLAILMRISTEANDRSLDDILNTV